jgi:replicative DNA helicase
MLNYPHNTDAEQNLLSCFLQYNSSMRICPDLREEHFFHASHKWIFRKLKTAIDDGNECTIITLRHELDQCDGLEPSYLAALQVKWQAPPAALGQMRDLVIDLATKREIFMACEKVLSFNSEKNLSDMIAALSEGIDSANRHALSKRIIDGQKVHQDIIKGVETTNPTITTGFNRIDKALNGGIRRRKMYIVGGASGDGKTLLAVAISNAVRKRGARHLFICAEMGAEETHARSLSIDTDINSEAFDNPQKRCDDFYVKITRPVLNESLVFYYDDPFLTFDALKQAVSTAVARDNIEGFFLDYGQLVGGWNSRGNKSDFFGEVAQWIAAACKKWNIWAIVTVQMNREGDVLGSGGFKRACDDMFIIQRPDKTKPYAWLKRDKARGSRFMDVGSETDNSLMITENGYFVEYDQSSVYSYGQ